jgi:hypothetical protein
VDTGLASPILTQREIALFQERGFHIHGRLFTVVQVQAIRDACEQVLQGTYETGAPPDDINPRSRTASASVKSLSSYRLDVSHSIMG